MNKKIHNLGILIIMICLLLTTKKVNADTYEEYINEVISNGELTINSIIPKSSEEAYSYITYNINKISKKYSNKYGYSGLGSNGNDVDENFNGKYKITFCEYKNINGYKQCENQKEVEFIINFDDSKIDKNIQAKISEYIDNFPKGKQYNYWNNNPYEILIEIDDMELLSYLARFNNGNNELLDLNNIFNLLKYNSKYREITKNINLVHPWIFGGNGLDIGASIGCDMLFEYNDFIYGKSNTLIRELIINAIYIDESVEDDNTSIIKAVQSRLDDNFGKGVSQVSLADNSYFEEQIDEMKTYYMQPYNTTLDNNKLVNQLFTINIGGYDYKFIVIKDSSKIKELSRVKTIDFKSESSIEFDSKYVPADSTISVLKYDDNDQILKKLNLKNGITYDISLYSESLKEYITRSNEKKFIVSVPINNLFNNNQKIFAYFIDENDKIEKIETNVKDGMATFETEHFSTYTIGIEKEESTTIIPTEHIETTENPGTSDDIYFWIIVLFISIIGVITIIKKEKTLNKGIKDHA